MAGEHKRERSVLETGVDKGLPPITSAGDDLEKMNAVGGADDKVNRKKKQPSEEVVKVSDKDQATKKKMRFIWTCELHKRFLDAVKHLGFNRAVPTKILELMNVEDLTRENVASHLQKYRLQMKRKDQERAQARAASGNVPKAVYRPMSGIPQQPWVLPSTMQGINTECARLDRSQLAPSFANHNLNMIQGFPSIQERYGTPFKDVGLNRMSSARLVHGLYGSNGPFDINKFVHNYGPLPPKPLVDSYAHKLMDQSYFHDTTLVPLYDRLHQLSLADQGIISPSFVPQYDRRDELSLADQGIISPSFVPQYDRRDELSVADQGIISPSLAQEGLGVGMPRLPGATGGLTGIGLGELGVRMPRLPEAAGGLVGMKVERIGGLGVGVPHPPRATGGLTGMKVEGLGGLGLGVPHPPEETRGLSGMKVEELGGVGVGGPRPPEAIGGLAGMKVEELGGVGVGVPRPPEAIGGLAGMKVEELGAGPEATGGLGLGVPRPPEATGGLARTNDFQQGFSFDEELELTLDLSDFLMNMEEDDDGKSFDDLFWR